MRSKDINIALSAFSGEREHVLGKTNLMLHTKIAVYNAVIISTMLYGCESGPIPSSYQDTEVFSHQMSPVTSWTSLVEQCDSY